MDQLKEHFVFELDDRYHCKHCGFNTQLPNKALGHLQKKHSDQLAAAEDQEPEPGQDQVFGQGGWGSEPDLVSVENILDEEEQ